MAKRNRSTASQLLNLYGNHVDADDARARLQERDERIAADNRTEAEIFLGDPPRDRSALARAAQPRERSTTGPYRNR